MDKKREELSPNYDLVYKLRERIKELDCIYAVSHIAVKPNIPFDQRIQMTADRIPSAFQKPEATCARITIDNETVKSANFNGCHWALEVDIPEDGRIVGKVEVGYLDPVPHENSPFLEEEKKLLQVIAARIGMMFHAKTATDNLEQLEKRYQSLLENVLAGFSHGSLEGDLAYGNDTCPGKLGYEGMEEALSINAQYRKLIDNALIGITQTTMKGELIYANATCLRMFGYESLEEARSAGSVGRYCDPRHRNTLAEILKQNGKVTNFEAECTTKTGEPIFILFSATLESDVMTGMMMDITKRKRVEKALARSEKGLSEAQRIAHLGSWEWDADSGTLHCSDEAYRIFGLKPQEARLTFAVLLGMVHHNDRSIVDQAIKEALSGHPKEGGIEHRILRPDGSERWVHARGETIFSEDHRPICMVGTVHDITGRKHSEQALQKAFDEIKMLKEKLEAENVYLRDEVKLAESYGDILGTSNALKYAIYRIRQVARTSTTVLLSGETGAGKGLFARFIHRESDRRDKSFVNVNCAGLPPNLIESELFGREKGAFTGSTARQIGRFELANHGTIFLDEIGELPMELQAKLLKVIEDREFERLGNPHPVKVDVRIIASTNRDLEEEVQKGRFRRDLFFRLNIFPISIPPLRERKGDIPLLAKAFVAKFGRTYGKGIMTIPARTMEVLEQYPWPGNVRELINVLERAIIVSEGPELLLDEKMEAPATEASPQENTLDGRDAPLGTELVEIERGHILKTLYATGWRISGPQGAAGILDINPSTLRTRMKKLGISRPGNHKE